MVALLSIEILSRKVEQAIFIKKIIFLSNITREILEHIVGEILQVKNYTVFNNIPTCNDKLVGIFGRKLFFKDEESSGYLKTVKNIIIISPICLKYFQKTGMTKTETNFFMVQEFCGGILCFLGISLTFRF